MSLNNTPSGERTHIGFFGLRNAGKSSLVNALTGQQMAVVSDVKGTTTDPVKKAMEILPLGPVVIIDTPGFDDEGELGAERVKRTEQILATCDIAVLVVDANLGLADTDRELAKCFEDRKVPWLMVLNKSDLYKLGLDDSDLDKPNSIESDETNKDICMKINKNKIIHVSATTGYGINELKERLAHLIPDKNERRLVGDLVSPGDVCILVCPIDESAPKGRLILPQQLAIRDLLDSGAIPIVCRDTELEEVLNKPALNPKLVITDSQVFKKVGAVVPDEITLTSFSILMARYKGFLETAVNGISAVKDLQDDDKVLLAEGCTHHRQCNDIGTVKIPRWLSEYTGKELVIETCSGNEFPDNLTQYKLVIHCGGCMLTENAVLARMNLAIERDVPFTNYGIAIAFMTGTLERSLRLFPDLHERLK